MISAFPIWPHFPKKSPIDKSISEPEPGIPHQYCLLNNGCELLDFGDDIPILVLRECLHGLSADVALASCAKCLSRYHFIARSLGNEYRIVPAHGKVVTYQLPTSGRDGFPSGIKTLRRLSKRLGL